MSAVQVAPPERVASPSLASNNPFRNKLGSNPPSPTMASASVAKPVSKNPFLDSTEGASELAKVSLNEKKGGVTETTTELLSGLDINGKPQSPNRRPRPPMKGAPGPRRENVPQYRRGPPPGHRPSLSEEERKRREAKMRGPNGELDIFADPADPTRLRERRHPRRNSESSIRDKPETEEERRRRERRRRESKHPNGKPKNNKKLDVIDKLDVTSIYGTGLFHHDGPFDACNPHRNRKGSRQAPMQAFPADSLNMKMGGAGPLNKNIDIDQFHGRGQEAHGDYNEAAIVDEDAEYVARPRPGRTTSYNPTQREVIHGNESAGLGTSTFLEGAPASRTAIAQNQAAMEQQQQAAALSRKKSLAQRIRGARSNTLNARATSPEGLTPNTPLDSAKSENNANPFFKDYDKEYEKKGAQIAFAEEQGKTGRSRAPSSPKRGPLLERSRTVDSAGLADEVKNGEVKNGEAKPIGSGFLNRVKSLKGGRRAKPERRDTSA